MVLRYWGMVGVRPEDFEHLVSHARGGIRADDLGASVRELGWEVVPFRGQVDEVRRHLRLGRPIVSLIEVGRDRYHYVVLVGTVGDRLILHDPAATPFRLVDVSELAAAWEATDGLSLLIVPPPGGAPNARPVQENAAPDPVDWGVKADCRPRLDEALGAAEDDRLEEAAALLGEGACSAEPVFQRELAGVRLRQGQAAAAVVAARAAVDGAPRDAHAAKILGAALYLADDDLAALEAWNRAGEPTVDLVRIAGLQRVSHRSAAGLLGLEGGELLTRSSLRLAGRRLSDLPAAAFSRVTYTPTGGGRADVVAGLAEKPGLPTTAFPLVATGLRAALYREIALTVVTPLGLGESWSGTWRWWQNRPAASFRFAAPAPVGLPAIWSLSAAWERETFAFLPAGQAVEVTEERTGAAAAARAWLLPDLAGTVRFGYDRWDEHGAFARGGLSTEVRLAGDHLRVTTTVDGWLSLEEAPGLATGSARVAATSRTTPVGFVLSGNAYVRTATARAPMTLWPGAGAGFARPDLLRAHSLLDGGVVVGEAFDRHLAGASAELTRWFEAAVGIRVGGAAFLDAARSWGVRASRSLVDAGVGLRVSTAAGGPTLRLDLATGLSDDEWAVTAGWSLGDDHF